MSILVGLALVSGTLGVNPVATADHVLSIDSADINPNNNRLSISGHTIGGRQNVTLRILGPAAEGFPQVGGIELLTSNGGGRWSFNERPAREPACVAEATSGGVTETLDIVGRPAACEQVANIPPVCTIIAPAAGTVFTLPAGGTVTVSFSATADDLDGNALSATAAFPGGTPAAVGPVTGVGTVTITQDVVYDTAGQKTLSITADETDTTPPLSCTASVIITVEDEVVANQPPVARGDAYATPRGNQLAVPATRLSGVLYNDFDPDGDPITIVDPGPRPTTSAGNATLNADGSFTYTPEANFTGVDSFSYTITDGINPTVVAKVNIDVTPRQDALKIMMNYELGMHCTGFEFAYCCVLPAYNSILAQVVKPAIGDPTQSDEDFVDGFPRILEGDPNNGRNLDFAFNLVGAGQRETVLRDPELNPDGTFKKYVLTYSHDAQARNEGQGKVQTSRLISQVEGNSLLAWNTRADAAAQDPVTGALILGPSPDGAALNVVQGDGVYNTIDAVFSPIIGPTPVDNYQNAVWNHLYIYDADTEGVRLCVDDPNKTHCFTDDDCAGIGPQICGDSTEANKLRLGLDVGYPTNFGPAGHAMGPTLPDGGPVLTFSGDTGTVVYTQMKLVENLPVTLTSPRIWEALGLPLTPFEDTIGFFADPGLVDEDTIRPYVQMKAQLHEADCPSAAAGGGDCTIGAAVMAGGHPVIGFGDAPIDIPNCERCHSAFDTPNSPNQTGTAETALVQLEIDFWKAYYNIVPPADGGTDSDWYARLKGAAISILARHDAEHGTGFLDAFPASSQPGYAGPFPFEGGLFNPGDIFPGVQANCLVNNVPDPAFACTTHAECGAGTDGICDIPQNTRTGVDSVICQKCHADNVIAVVKSANCNSDPDGNPATNDGVCVDDPFGINPLIVPLTEALHDNHRNVSEPGGVITFADGLGRDGGCQGCHPAHRSDGVMDNYPIDLDGNNAFATGDNRLAQGGCFVGRDVHSNPMKDVDGAETPSHLNAVGEYLLANVALDQDPGDGSDWRGIWCTNCHSQLSQEIWKAENCTDLINNDCAQGENPRTAADMTALATQLGFPLEQIESWADPKDPAIDPDLPESGPGTRTVDDTHTIWRTDPGRSFAFPVCEFLRDPTNPAQDANVATIEVSIGATPNCDSPVPFGPVNCSDENNGGAGPTFFLCGSEDADGDFSVNVMDFCTTGDCVTAAQATLTTATALAVPFSAATDARDHWLSAGEPHCADCHKAPYTEQSGNINAFAPFNYPRKASLMRYSRGHQDITCQGCHESIHGLYPVTPTVDSTSYAQAAALNNDGSHGPLKCESCHTHVNAAGVPTWVDDLSYSDPIQGGNTPVQNNFDAAVSWAHMYTDEADPRVDVCRNCHGNFQNQIADDDEEWLEHAMVNRVSRVAMDDAEILQLGAVAGSTDPLNTVCTGCHDDKAGDVICDNSEEGLEWKAHLVEGRVAESVWEAVSLDRTLTTCGW